MSYGPSPRRRRAPVARRHRTGPALERLERRDLLAPIQVLNTDDDGAGSLRRAIQDANATAASDVIQFAIPGPGPFTIAPTSALPALVNPVAIDGTSQAGYAGAPIVEIDGTNAGASATGLNIRASDCAINGLAINGFKGRGIFLESGSRNLIRGNYIGTNLAGSAAKPNGGNGIEVGGSSAAPAANNTIGGTTPGAGNVISGNGGVGIRFSSDFGTATLVQGNRIGTDATGSFAVGNTFEGINSGQARFNTIGGTTPGAGNLISGNGFRGIFLFGLGSVNATISGNFIGTNAAGTQAIRNNGKGIDNFGFDNIVITDNLVSGNADVGMNLGGNNILVQNNKVGTDISGLLPIANQNNGIAFGFGGSNVTIGGTAAGQANIIAFNRGKGITIGGSNSQGNRILGNSIFANAGLGIDLNDDGVTLNGATSPRSGTNLLQNFPVLTSVAAGGVPAINGTLQSTPSSTFRVEFFSSDAPDSSGYGQGRTFLGAADVTTNASGSASFTYFPAIPIAANASVAATATDPNGNTSEFSAVKLAAGQSPGVIQFGSATYGVGEAGGQATITVTRVGGSAGVANVVCSTGSGSAIAGADYTATSVIVSFADGEAGTKTVAIPILDDVVAEGNETVDLSFFPGAGTTLGPVSTAVLTIVDDDAPGVTVTPTSGLVTTEAGGTATFTVRLNSQPTASVTIGLTSGNPPEGVADRSSLVFTPTNWNVPQAVTVRGVNDAVDDGDVAYSIVTSAAASADPMYNGLAVADVGVLNIDDDVAGGGLGPTAGLVTNELGGTATFTIFLRTQPTADVTFPLSSTRPTEGVIDRSAVVFTPANWNVPQTVTIRGVADQVVDGDAPYTIVVSPSRSADPYYDGIDYTDVAVVNLNTDAAGFEVTPTSGLVTTELGGTATFAVRLTSRPAGPVTIGVASANPGEATPSLASLVFTPANWNVPQTVLVTGQADHVIDPDRALAIVLGAAASTDPDYNGFKPADVGVTNLNADAPGVSITPLGPPATTEAGGTARFSVQLPNRPNADVTLAFASNNPAEGVVTTPSLVFTPDNWNTPQVLVVAGVDDPRADGPVGYAVTGSASGADPFYNNLQPNPVAVVNADDDAAGFTLFAAGGLVTTEAGGTATFFLRLNTQPAADVTIPFRPSNPAEGSVAPASVTFTPANWNVPQAVTVGGVDDAVADGNVAYTIDAGATVTGDPAYAGIRSTGVGVTNVDDDVAGIAVTPTSPPTTTAAGGAATFAVALRSRPRTPVAVTLASTDPGQGTVAAPTLIFTPDNWNVPQLVSVVGSGRGGRIGSIPYAVAVTATSQDAAYNNLAGPTIALTNVNPPAVPVVGVQVIAVKVGKRKTQALAVSFGVAIDPAAAANPANYQLVGAGRDGKLGTRDDVRLGLAAATYDPATGSVRLNPGRKVSLSAAPVQLRVVAAGLLDASGRPVDGNRDGLPGGDAVATIRKKRVTLS